jgi:tripeptidyl-peptidase-1
VPTWPATSPYVTAVGGMQDTSGAATISSGGFSNYFPQQKYQETAVEQYVMGLKPSTLYNVSGNYFSPYGNRLYEGRAYPDVCSFAENVEIILGNGYPWALSGTSCAAPVCNKETVFFSLILFFSCCCDFFVE